MPFQLNKNKAGNLEYSTPNKGYPGWTAPLPGANIIIKTKLKLKNPKASLLEGIVKQEPIKLAGRDHSMDDLRYLFLPKSYT